MSKLPISLQLYTLRDLTAKDFAGTVKQVAAIGYRYVELGGFGNLKTAIDARKALDDAGLKVTGAHIGFDALEKELHRVMDEQQTVGNNVLIIPWLAENRRNTAAAYKQLVQSITHIATHAKQHGFELAYHNHDFEFKPIEGTTGMELIFDASDPSLLKSELDVYWVKRGGVDPVALIRKLGSRVTLLHLKDLAAGPEHHFAEVGTGTLDFKGIIAAGMEVGVRFGVVEQDSTYQTPPLDAVKTSFENLQKMGII